MFLEKFNKTNVNINIVVCRRRKLMTDIISMIKTPLGAVLMLVVTLVLAGLTIAAAVSGELTAAAVSAAGLLVVVFIIAMINYVGKS